MEKGGGSCLLTRQPPLLVAKISSLYQHGVTMLAFDRLARDFIVELEESVERISKT